MKKITLSALALLVVTASAFTLRSQTTAQLRTDSRETATNAAFRDGLYLGKLASEGGSEYRVASARWARANDRASFAAGYDQGYNTSSVVRAAK